MKEITKILDANATEININNDLNPDDLAPNNYLTIIWKDVQTGKIVNTLDIDNEQAIKFTNDLTSAIEKGIESGKVTYAGKNRFINMESIGKYLSQNVIKTSTKRTVVNALIGLASGEGKRTPNHITNLCLGVFGTIADKSARKLGLSDPHDLFSQVAGENVIDVFKQLGSQTKNFLDNCISKINGSPKTNVVSQDGTKGNTKKFTGLLLGLTTSDTESFEITIPRRKVEDGSDYSTHLLPQPWKKEFSVVLTNKVLTSNHSRLAEIDAIEKTKDKMIEIARSRTLFDIYIRLSNDRVYKRSNVVFSSLSFTKDENSGNGYTANFTVEPFNIFKTKTFISNKKYGTKSTGSGGGTGSKKTSTSSRKQDKKTSKGNSLEYGYLSTPNRINTCENLDELKRIAQNSSPQQYIIYNATQKPHYMLTTECKKAGDRYALTKDFEKIHGYGSYAVGRGKNLAKDVVKMDTKYDGNMGIKSGKTIYYIIPPQKQLYYSSKK